MKKRKSAALLLALFTLASAACAGSAQAEPDIALPQSLKIIEDGAFQGDTEIREIVLPDLVEKIGSKAFADSGLIEITFPESLTDVAADAFDGCDHIEAHAEGDQGAAIISALAAGGCDIANAGEVLDAITTYALRTAAGQTIRRTFAAPQTGRYTFTAAGAADVTMIRYDQSGSMIAEKNGGLSFNLPEDGSAYFGFRFADGTSSGDFSLSVARTENPMAAIVYTPALWVCKDDQPVRNANMNGSLVQLAVGEVLTPSLQIENTGKYKVAGQVLAVLDGQTVDLGFFALGAEESCTVHMPAAAAFAAETAGSHTVDFSVKLDEAESAASMTWEIRDARPAPEAVVVKAGSNTVELSQESGNLFKFTPTKTGVYQFYTSNSNCDTYASLRDSAKGEVIVSDDNSGYPYQNFVFSYNLKANTPVYIDMGMRNYKSAIDIALSIDYCGTPSLKYSPGLYVFNGYSWVDADNGNLSGTGMVKLKGKGNLSTLESDEYLTPVLVITNSSSKAMPLGLTAELDGETIYWSGDCEIAGNGTFTAYLYSTAARMYETPGTHTIHYYVNGKLATSYTWEVSGNRVPNIYSTTPTLTLGQHYRHLDDTEGVLDWFEAPYTGIYRFYAARDTWDPCGFLFDENMNLIACNDNYGGSEAFTIYQYLEAGQNVYLLSMFFEDMRDTATIGVDFVSTEPAPARALSLGDTPMPMASGDTFTASFTAPYTGSFRFVAESGSGNTDGIKASLYDTYWQDLGVTSTGYFAYFNLKYTMNEGETVYLKAASTTNDSTAVLTVSGTAQ